MASRLVALSRLGCTSVGRNSHWRNQFVRSDGQTLNQTVLWRFKSAAATNPQSAEPETVPGKNGEQLINYSGGESVITGSPDVAVDSNPIDPAELSFCDPVTAYQSKTTLEIMRAALVLNLCQFDFLVKYNKRVK